MLISIIIPTFNSEKTIDRCLDSICSQKYKNLEIICVDDCSVDRTHELLNKIAEGDDRIVVISHDKNLGQSASRNDGIKRAKGEYVMFVDADDYIKKNAIESIANTLQKNKMPDVMRYNFVSNNKLHDNCIYGLDTDIAYTNKRRKELLKAIFVSKKRIPTYSVLLVIKKTIIKKLLFDEKMIYMEDTAFYYDTLSLANSVIFSNLCLYVYEENKQSITRSCKNHLDKIYSMLRLCERIDNWTEFTTAEKKTVMAYVLSKIAGVLMRLGADDYATYKDLINKICSNTNFLKFVNYGDLKKISRVKKLYLTTIKKYKKATATIPFLLIGKMRYR